MKFILFSALVAAAVSQQYDRSRNEVEWERFKIEYPKDYKSMEEELKRKQIFLTNLKKINEHNSLYDKAVESFKLGVNIYTDLTEEEIAATIKGYRKYDREDFVRELYLDDSGISLPKSVDWRTKGAVTPVKNQHHCGACWAFSATGCLESHNFLKHGILESLSEQNLLDCLTPEGNRGCDGGDPLVAFKYVKDNNGIDTENSYHYEAKEDNCQYNPKNKGATVTDYVRTPFANEEQLKIAVATKGPVSVAIDSRGDSFYHYKTGLHKNYTCQTMNLDHAVLVVGYGTTSEGDDYWLVKNSWGHHWGAHGYILMARNRNNMCGIATEASYPIV